MHYKHYLPCYETFIIIYSQQALCNLQSSFHVGNAIGTMKIKHPASEAAERKAITVVRVLAYSTTKHRIFLPSCRLPNGL